MRSDDSDIPLWLVIGLVLVMIAGVGLVGAVMFQQEGDAKDGPSYPAQWDARVLPFVRVVEKERNLTFLHPVEVRFLSGEAFEKEVTTDEKELDDDEREEIEQFSGLMRALGLVDGDVDLFKAFNQAYGTGTLAYYSFEDERITIRGEKLSPAVRATLVHELTHALQDQRFDVGDRVEKLRKDAEDGADSTVATVLDAVIEGDAERVAAQYRESLAPKARRALEEAEGTDQADSLDGLKGVPKVVLSMISSPYALGQAMVQAVAEEGGNSGVDELYTDTPEHESVLLDPFRVLTGDVDAAEVDVPELAAGEEKFDAGAFGVLTWYFMLAERLPVLEALAVTDGWGGDAYVAFDRAGRTCVRIAYTGGGPADTGRMHQALRRWVRTAPEASVIREGADLLFESCDPGTTAEAGNDASMKALEVAATRAYLGIGLLDAGAPTRVAQCFAHEAVIQFPLSQLNDPAAGNDPELRSRIQQVAAGCR